MQPSNTIQVQPQAQPQYNLESPTVWQTCFHYLARTVKHISDSDPFAASLVVPDLLNNLQTLTTAVIEARAQRRLPPSILTLDFMKPELLHKFMTTMPPDQIAAQADVEFSQATKINPRSLVREIRITGGHECVLIFPTQKYSEDAKNFLSRVYHLARAQFDKSNVGEIRYQILSNTLVDPYTPPEYFVKVCVYKKAADLDKVDFQALLEFSKQFASDEVCQKAADELSAFNAAKALSSLEIA